MKAVCGPYIHVHVCMYAQNLDLKQWCGQFVKALIIITSSCARFARTTTGLVELDRLARSVQIEIKSVTSGYVTSLYGTS